MIRWLMFITRKAFNLVTKIINSQFPKDDSLTDVRHQETIQLSYKDFYNHSHGLIALKETKIMSRISSGPLHLVLTITLSDPTIDLFSFLIHTDMKYERSDFLLHVIIGYDLSLCEWSVLPESWPLPVTLLLVVNDFDFSPGECSILPETWL